MNMRKIAVYLTIAQILTVIWILSCPKYAQTGATETRKTEVVSEESGWSQRGNGPKITTYRNRTILTGPFLHPDPVYFGAGLLVIYGLLASAFLWNEKRGKTWGLAAEDAAGTPTAPQS